MCRVLKVSTSGYYKWAKNQAMPPSKKEERRKELQQKIKKSYYKSGKTYGSPRVHADLIDRGYTISLKTVARMMKGNGADSPS
ncbi:IS3 family transposase [Peribacillus deserti]